MTELLSSLETFIQPFLHRPERVSRSALLMVAQVLKCLRGGVDKTWSLISSPSRLKPAEPSLYELCRYTSETEASCVKYQRPTTPFRTALLVLAMSRRIERITVWYTLPVEATIFHAATKDRAAGKIMRNGLLHVPVKQNWYSRVVTSTFVMHVDLLSEISSRPGRRQNRDTECINNGTS